MMQKTNKPIPEPRVFAKPLPLSGLVKMRGMRNAVVFIECKCGGGTEAKIFRGIKDSSVYGQMAVFSDGDLMMLDVYGKTWRAWAFREPTQVELANAPGWKE